MAVTKRARVDRGMVMEMRVVGDKEGEGNDKKEGVGDKGWRATKRAMATATRAMSTRVTGEKWRRGGW